MENTIRSLEERAKELNCLYQIEELASSNMEYDSIIQKAAEAIPLGMQYPEFIRVEIVIDKDSYTSSDFQRTETSMLSRIKVQDEEVGTINVYYLKKVPISEPDPFLTEERKLINTIADRLGYFILHHRLKDVFNDFTRHKLDNHKPEWMVVLEMLKKTDQSLFSIVSRKMLIHLFCKGIKESKVLFEKMGTNLDIQVVETEVNRPSKKQVMEKSFSLGFAVFELASKYFSGSEIMYQIQRWVHDDKSHFLVKALANPITTLTEIGDAIRRYHNTNPSYVDFTSPTEHGIKVSLLRRFLTDQLEFINIAKNYCNVADFYDLLQNIITPSESQGRLGGKSAGLFLAKKILEKSPDSLGLLSKVKTPKTWYISADGLMSFAYYNNLEDVIEQKYKPIEDVRQEYPHIIQAFKNSHIPGDITNGLSRALDDFGDKPIIVRSSSLLEDRLGSAFAGKYKSLFLANQGTKQERLEDLADAIAEVYASTFGPDPIGYRTERNLLDYNEEMGIMIQEVVGRKVGKYYLPAFAGVAFTYNEFRWSPRIKREDGLIRLVPGLGTRAVDRIGDDYPVLITPGQPELRVNITLSDIRAYSPKNIDVINLETNTFETISIKQLISEIGDDYPMMNEVFSIVEENYIKKPIGLGIDTKKHDIVVTFENMLSRTDNIKCIGTMLNILSDKLETPVDIEFASDGEDLYLLQCRPQSSSFESISAVIPQDAPANQVIFTANRYVSNGKSPDVAYIVYVDPEKYAETSSLDDLKDVGKAVGKLNKLLPKKTFILMGPGRWGSRDDIRLGVKVTYSDINNTGALIEIALKKGSYTPDLSFGTHFFQDLVEASIRYLPLYPDDEEVVFNKEFFENSENVLERFLPEYKNIAGILKVINVRETSGGKILRLLMNAEEDKAMALLTEPGLNSSYNNRQVNGKRDKSEAYDQISNEPLEWRKRMVDGIVHKMDAKRFGIKELYLTGTVFLETASANSDIDLIVIFNGNEEQRKEMTLWFEGWNHALSQINYNKSGYSLERFLDIIVLTPKELTEQKYYSDLIEPINNSVKKLTLKVN